MRLRLFEEDAARLRLHDQGLWEVEFGPTPEVPQPVVREVMDLMQALTPTRLPVLVSRRHPFAYTPEALLYLQRRAPRLHVAIAHVVYDEPAYTASWVQEQLYAKRIPMRVYLSYDDAVAWLATFAEAETGRQLYAQLAPRYPLEAA